MFKKFCYGYYDAPSSVGDVSGLGDGKTGKNGNLPADVDERKVLDRLDDKDDDTKDDKKDGKSGKSGDKDKDSDADEEGLEDLDDEEEEKEGKDDKDKEEEDEEDDELTLDDKEDDTSLYQKLKAKDKGIFKEIPELKHVLFREQEFTKFFPTVDDAKQASEAAETFMKFQDDIQSGDAKTFVEATKELGEDTLRDFSGNFLTALLETDKDVYYDTVAPEFKRMLRAALQSDNDDIKQSARNINWFLWKTLDVEKDEGFTAKTKKDPREDKIAQREKEFNDKQHQTFAIDVKSVGMRKVERVITKSLEGFELSELTKNHLTAEIIKRTITAMSKDVRYNGQMNVLWEKAKKNGYVTEGKESILNAFLSRAKVSIPKIRQQVLSEAKVSAKEGSDDKETKRATRLSGNSSVGKSGQALGKIDPKKVDWNQTNERDLLDGKAPVMRK